MHTARFATAAIVFLGAGCVPLTDYRKLEDRYKEQEKYVQKHKDEITEFQKREQLLTMEMKEKQRLFELSQARLVKSEELRKISDANRGKPIVVSEQLASNHASTDAAWGGFKVNSETGGIVLEHDVLFDKGQHSIKSSGKKILEELVVKLNSAEYGKYCIRVDGHTDDTKVVKTIKENHDNWELGFKRAKAVFDFMVSKGISEKRCFLATFGEFRPMNTSGIESAPAKHAKKGQKKTDTSERAQNRRVEIVLFEKKI